MNQNVVTLLEDSIDIWERLCRQHSELFDLTCDEYLNLLSSDMDLLEETVAQKEALLEKISFVDNRRLNLIKEFNNKKLIDFDLTKASQLIEYFKMSNAPNALHLERLNALLIDIIVKIQDQNKKNQIFLNKAIRSLDDLKQSFKGGKKLTTYGPKGKAVTKNY